MTPHCTAMHRDLVYDIGMHKGEDTDYYLRKGFRVVGFEADPDLVEHCKHRFADAIESGRLTIIEGAIVETTTSEIPVSAVKFYKNVEKSIFGTTEDTFARRNERLGTHIRVIEVKPIDLTACLKKYGIPYYMKVDIEGSDRVCLRSLLGFELKPSYVSIESEKFAFERLREELDLLEQLGYDRFKAVQQQTVSHQAEPRDTNEGTFAGYRFHYGSSGLFGSDLPGIWRNKGRMLRGYRITFILYRWFGDDGYIKKFFVVRVLRRLMELALRRPIPGWYDTHARHSSVESKGRDELPHIHCS